MALTFFQLMGHCAAGGGGTSILHTAETQVKSLISHDCDVDGHLAAVAAWVDQDPADVHHRVNGLVDGAIFLDDQDLQPSLRGGGVGSDEGDVMQVGFRTVDGVRVRCAESTGPSAPAILLTSPWPESVYAES